MAASVATAATSSHQRGRGEGEPVGEPGNRGGPDRSGDGGSIADSVATAGARLKSGRQEDDDLEMTEAAEATATPWWVRVRSAVLLVLLLVLIGLVVAAALGLIVLAVGTVFDRALA